MMKLRGYYFITHFIPSVVQRHHCAMAQGAGTKGPRAWRLRRSLDYE
ncbi:MAG: hypothetical protein RDV48_12525 [Candidatus Eremiobacteraeota bacterium]|nr:hypothetical protein [Candidatus Eremiobacteraeota bacterium]